MSYLGGGPYHAEPCPECGAILWNGRCENPDCYYHWHPKEDEEDDKLFDEESVFEGDLAVVEEGEE